MIRLLGALAVILVATAALGQEFQAGIGPTIHHRCHMDECSFATIGSSRSLAVRSDGELFKVEALAWGSQYKPRDEDEYSLPPISTSTKRPSTFTVFCSKTHPMIFYPAAPGVTTRWIDYPLRPGDDQAVFGVSENAYQDYWAACHHFFPKSAYDPLIAKLAPRLGYHFSGGFPDDGSGEEGSMKPSDLLR